MFFYTHDFQTPAVSQSQSFSQLEKLEEVEASVTSAEDKLSKQQKPVTKTPEMSPPSLLSESSESKKKPAGAVSLFGGIDVLASKQTKSPLDDVDSNDNFLSRESPPPIVKKDEKVKKITVSLFDDDDDDEEDESEWNEPIFSKPMARNTKVCMTPSLKNLND